MSSFLRPLLRSRAWQLPCRHRHRQHTPHSFSATLRPQRSFFTTPQLRYHPNSTQNLLDKIPTSFVFWGILGLNGAVFCLWQAAAGRSVRVPLPLPALPLTTSLAESRKGPFCPYVDVSQLYQQHRQPQKRKIVRFFSSSPVPVLIPSTSWTIITCTFSHQDVGHIFFNMFTFYFLGRYLLEAIGSRQFILLYLGGRSLPMHPPRCFSPFSKAAS